jgi:hypothetical protein
VTVRKARIVDVWGKPPPSVWNALTERQQKALERYIDKRVIEVCYRIAYDCGLQAGRKPKRPHPR